MDVKVRCKDDKYTRHYKADKVLYCNNGKYRFVNVIVGNFVSSFHLDDIVEFEAVDLVADRNPAYVLDWGVGLDGKTQS